MLVIVVVHRHRIIGCFSPLALRKSSLHGGRFLVRSNLAIREMPIKTLNLEHILWALEKGVLISLSALFKCIFHLLMWHWELHPDLQAEGGGALGLVWVFWNLWAHSQWHTSSMKSTPPNPSNPFMLCHSLVVKHSNMWTYGGGVILIQTTTYSSLSQVIFFSLLSSSSDINTAIPSS